ncbi:hypothetical protein DER30_7222 [Streptomyces sp. HB202]|nr:hypothetical protein DER30_7222 [Streptomyces sp. HB202]
MTCLSSDAPLPAGPVMRPTRGSSWTIAHATSTPKNSHTNCDAHWVAAYAIHGENGTEPSREPVPHLRGRSQ